MTTILIRFSLFYDCILKGFVWVRCSLVLLTVWSYWLETNWGDSKANCRAYVNARLAHFCLLWLPFTCFGFAQFGYLSHLWPILQNWKNLFWYSVVVERDFIWNFWPLWSSLVFGILVLSGTFGHFWSLSNRSSFSKFLFIFALSLPFLLFLDIFGHFLSFLNFRVIFAFFGHICFYCHSVICHNFDVVEQS